MRGLSRARRCRARPLRAEPWACMVLGLIASPGDLTDAEFNELALAVAWLRAELNELALHEGADDAKGQRQSAASLHQRLHILLNVPTGHAGFIESGTEQEQLPCLAIFQMFQRDDGRLVGKLVRIARRDQDLT